MQRAAVAIIVLAFLLANPARISAADLASQIEMLERSVEALGAERVLNGGLTRSLTVKLSHAMDALRQADAKRVSSQLRAFENQSRGLVASGRVPVKPGTALIDGAISARLAVERIAFTVPPIMVDLPQPCAITEPCEMARLWVDPRGGKGASGTEDSPFPTIADAIALARQQGACGVELRLAPGRYEENVDVSLDLRVIGEGEGVVLTGSIVNYAGWDLHLERVVLQSSSWPGAIIVDSQCDSRTEISRVRIDGAAGSGIFQRGGSIRIGLTTIRGVRAVPGAPESGTALWLTGGTKAVLGLVGIEENAAGGILAEGEETGVYAAGVLIERNEVTPFAEVLEEGALPQGPGIDVRDGALLLMQFSVVRDNDLYGLLLRNGARAHVRYSKIERTRRLPSTHAYEWLADANVLVDDGSAIELDSYLVAHSLAGIILRNSLGSGSRGEISHHAIGIGLLFSSLPTGEEVSNLVTCMTDRTRMLHNDRNVDSTILPLPPTDPPGGEPPPPPVCERVAFDCAWCGS